jgi:hypothetical protein
MRDIVKCGQDMVGLVVENGDGSRKKNDEHEHQVGCFHIDLTIRYAEHERTNAG